MSADLPDLRLRATNLVTGDDGPALVAAEWAALGIAERLAPFDPVLVSSHAAGLGLPDSDLDVVCDLRPPGFVPAAGRAFGEREGFEVHDQGPRLLITFQGPTMLVELVAEARPVEEQLAYRHAAAHRRLVATLGQDFAAAVRLQRAEHGLKTEPAIAAVLGLPGDPYSDVEGLATADANVLHAHWAAAQRR